MTREVCWCSDLLKVLSPCSQGEGSSFRTKGRHPHCHQAACSSNARLLRTPWEAWACGAVCCGLRFTAGTIPPPFSALTACGSPGTSHTTVEECIWPADTECNTTVVFLFIHGRGSLPLPRSDNFSRPDITFAMPLGCPDTRLKDRGLGLKSPNCSFSQDHLLQS